MYGELTIYEPTTAPIYKPQHDIKHNVRVFVTWIDKNYERGEHGFNPPMEYENSLDLESEFNDLALSTLEILRSEWGRSVDEKIIREMVNIIDLKQQDDWYPSHDRINL